jgi:predicted GNAT family N-acyltransferase
MRRRRRAFYLKLGFTPVGAEFLELSIPHIEMVKALDLPPSSRAAKAETD